MELPNVTIRNEAKNELMTIEIDPENTHISLYNLLANVELLCNEIMEKWDILNDTIYIYFEDTTYNNGYFVYLLQAIAQYITDSICHTYLRHCHFNNITIKGGRKQ